MSDAASFGIPTGRRVEGEASPGSASQIRVLPAADERTLEVAQRAWGDPAQASDFEQRGKTWVDKAGTVYKRVAGNPLAGYDQGVPIAAYFVADGNIIFLREADAAEHGTSQTLGSVGSRKAGRGRPCRSSRCSRRPPSGVGHEPPEHHQRRRRCHRRG